MEWTEQAAIANGVVVVVARKEVIVSYTEPGYSEARIGNASLQITPDNAAPLPALSVGEYPILVGIDDAEGFWFVVTNLETCQDIRKLVTNNRPYFEYSLKEGQWRRGEVVDNRVGLKANLLLDKSLATKKRFISVSDKSKSDSSSRIPNYMKEVVSKSTC